MKIDKVYTKTGDDGSTNLPENPSTSKTDIVIESLGSLDELNSFLGLSKSSIENNYKLKKIYDFIFIIQRKLFDIGSEISLLKSNNKKNIITNIDVEEIEKEIEILNKNLSSLESFILPGTGKENSFFHVTRSICRRAERVIISCQKSHQINSFSIKYLNRLSDLLFIYCRVLTIELKEKEETWK